MKKTYIFKKTHELNKELFAELLNAARGGRTMKDFAEACGVNPSTLTRIMQKANKGASSTELLEAIAEHAAPNSGVTLEELAQANGYTLERDTGIKATKLSAYMENSETLIRNILVQGLLDRGADVRMGRIRYTFSKSLSLSPDALLMTNAFGHEDEIWFSDSILAVPRMTRPDDHPINRSRVKQMAFEKLARFVFISMNKVDLYRPTRYSLVVFDQEMYDIIVEEFAETVVPTDISIIRIDSLNGCIANEYMLPHNEKGAQESYFMTTAVVEEDQDYLSSDIYDEEE